MKKALWALVVALVSMVLAIGAIAEDEYALKMNVRFEENWFFSIYDVSMYIDDAFVATYPHGVDFVVDTTIPVGKHKIIFAKADDPSYEGSIDVNVTGEVQIDCYIHCHAGYISITDQTVTIGKALDNVQSTEPISLSVESQSENDDQVSMIEQKELTLYDFPDTVTEEFVHLNIKNATDEELCAAADIIKAEQRARLKTKVVLDNETLTLAKGRQQKLTANVVEIPDGVTAGKLNWTTSDKNIVNVANGSVTAVNEGNAVIVCSTILSDGTEVYAECQVTVYVPVSNLSVKQSALKLEAPGSVDMNVSVKPENATNKRLEYSSSDGSVATVNEAGVITGTGAGTATITAKTTDGSEKTVSVKVTVSDMRITSEIAEKVAMVVISNDRAIDIFTADGNHFDSKKFHNYSYAKKDVKIVETSGWKTNDGVTWHIERLLVQVNNSSGYFKYKMDVRYDGKNYVVTNASYVSAAQKKYVDSNDSSKIGGDSLSPEFSTYLTVTPKMME